jgi:hypothetical protein
MRLAAFSRARPDAADAIAADVAQVLREGSP